MTLVCRVEHRFPVAVAALYGTLDESAGVGAVVTLHECLAGQPVQLVLDVAHLAVPAVAGLRPLAGLVAGARRWPGVPVAVSGAGPGLRELFDRVAGAGAVEFYPDTEAGLAAGRRLRVPPREAVELPPTRDAPAACRELVARACHRWGLDRWSRLTQLLASELVTNAVVHAGTQISFTLRHLDGVLQVVVRDRDPRLVDQPPRGPDRLPTGEPGRGLLLLATLADDWGGAPTGDGKVTWANVALHHRDIGSRPRSATG